MASQGQHETLSYSPLKRKVLSMRQGLNILPVAEGQESQLLKQPQDPFHKINLALGTAICNTLVCTLATLTRALATITYLNISPVSEAPTSLCTPVLRTLQHLLLSTLWILI